MKKIALFFTFILCLLVGSAQKPSLNKAYNAFSNQEYEEAKVLIDECISDPKLGTKATAFLYKGNIYMYLANREYEAKRANQNYQIKYPDAPVHAYNAFVKAKELDKNVEAYNMLSPDQAIPSLYGLLFVYGVDVLISNKYKEAITVFEKAVKCYEMTTPSYPLYGELYYYFGYAMEMDNNPDAKIYYEKAILDSSKNINVYIRLIEQYKKESNTEQNQFTINRAKALFPSDLSIKIAEVDYYFQLKDTVTARNLLYSLPNTIYQNADLLLNVSNCYIQDGNYVKAIELLNTANRLDPNNNIVIYNLGVCNYYLSNIKFKEYNESEVNGEAAKAYNAKKEYDKYINDAQLYFEKALEKEPDDLNVLNTLMSIYARLKSPKFEEVSKKIESLKKQ
jgi:tetratricopeptide (TPR) repeat protein